MLMSVLWVGATRPGQAQLLNVDRTFKVMHIDSNRYRIEVASLDGDHTATYILIYGTTQVTRQGQTVDWKHIPNGTIINVHGALTWDMKVKAQRIWYLE